MSSQTPPFHHKLAALVALTGISTSIGIAMKLSMHGNVYNYSPVSAVAMTELFKLVSSIIIVFRLVWHSASEKGTSFRHELSSFGDENFSWALMQHAVGLSLAYAVVNLVTFGVFAHAPASTFFLLKAASPVISALLLAGLVARPISPVQWVSIIAQCIGLITTQYDPCKNSLSLNVLAYVYISVNIAVSCSAGVWNEHIIKSFQKSVNAQNILLYSCGFALNIVLFFVLPPGVIGGRGGLSFFEGYSPAVVGVIFANGAVGLVITAVYKYADVIVKTFGLAGSTATLYALEALHLIPGSRRPASLPTFLGAAIVFYASWLYIAPPEADPKSTQGGDHDAGKEKDKTEPSQHANSDSTTVQVQPGNGDHHRAAAKEDCTVMGALMRDRRVLFVSTLNLIAVVALIINSSMNSCGGATVLRG